MSYLPLYKKASQTSHDSHPTKKRLDKLAVDHRQLIDYKEKEGDDS